MAVVEPDSTGAVAVKGRAIGRLSPGRWRDIAEAEGARLTIWSPVLLVCGIWSYFALAHEPGWGLTLGLLLAACVAAVRFRHVPLVLAVAICASGFALAKLRSTGVETALIRAYTPAAEVSGRVRDVDRLSARRVVLVIDVIHVRGLPPDEVPRRLRLQASGELPAMHVGDRIDGTAVLLPLPLPVAPGAFDYGRSLYFQSIGGTGRFTAAPRVAAEDVPLRYQLRRGFHALRADIGARVRAVIPGPLGSFADALITGERASIPRSMNQSLQASGLFHILSISGLHMAMVAGSAFWFVRALLALSPALALRRPIKKWAAAAAIIIGGFYMLLADGGAATERSFVMIAVMFLAVLVDRPAISLHNLAVAALVILVLSPEQAVNASFQMSFLAVMGLAAFFEWWNARIPRVMPQPPGRAGRLVRRVALIAIASLITSLIAGALSGIPAAHHFGRLAPYGVISNALALPVISVAVMPMALLAALLMPLSLETLPLLVMQQGLRAVMFISDWVASWPGANASLPLLSAPSAAALSFSAAFAAMARSALRWLALPAAVLAAWAMWGQSPPDLIVEERAQTMAAVDESGNFVPLPEKRGAFAVNKWLAARGQDEKAAVAAKRELWTCEAGACRARVRGRTVAFLRDSAEPVKACPSADVIIAQYPLRRRCRGTLATIDRFDVWRNGAHAMSFTETGVRIATARGEQGNRPWTVRPRPRAK